MMLAQPPENALLVIARRSQPNQTDPPLSPPLSLEQAAGLYHCFLQDTLDLMRRSPNLTRGIVYDPAQDRAYFAGLAPDFELLLQEGSSLGERLNHALSTQFERGFRRVVIMDSAGPTLPLAFLADAFKALDLADVVLGPVEDGGVYLIGLKRPAPRLLLEVALNSPSLLADTLTRARAERLRVALIHHWYAVHNSVSLERLLQELEYAPPELAPHTQRFIQAGMNAIV